MRRRTLRTALVGVLVFVMTIDSATAFHLFGGFRGCGRFGGWGRSYHYSSAHYSCGGGCSGSVVYHGGCGGGCGGCGGECGGYTAYDGGSVDGGVVVEQRAPEPMHPAQPPAQAPAQQPATVNRMEDATSVPQLPPDTMMTRPPVREMPTMQPAQPPVRMPAEETVPTTRPSERSPLDDLFGTTPTPTPAGGEGAAQPTMPTETFTPTTPTETPAATTPTPTTPASTTPAPTTPAPTTPPTTGGGIEDLFGTPTSGGTTPPAGGGTTPPAGGGATSPAGTTPPAGGGTPAPGAGQTPAGTTPARSPLEDLFGTPAGGEQPAVAPPAGERPATTPTDDNLFKQSAVLREAGGLASDANREWLDNTGQYTTRGRLVAFLDGHVRLLKDNGRTTTVPLYRLSQNDLDFVNRQAAAQRATRYGETVQVSAAVPLAAK